jgi:hypothetical protein
MILSKDFFLKSEFVLTQLGPCNWIIIFQGKQMLEGKPHFVTCLMWLKVYFVTLLVKKFISTCKPCFIVPIYVYIIRHVIHGND